MPEPKYIAGYTGYIPGEKWSFGHTFQRQPTANGKRPSSAKGRLRTAQSLNDLRNGDSVGNGIKFSNATNGNDNSTSFLRDNRHVEIISNLNTATQFPIETREASIQADNRAASATFANRSVPYQQAEQQLQRIQQATDAQRYSGRENQNATQQAQSNESNAANINQQQQQQASVDAAARQQEIRRQQQNRQAAMMSNNRGVDVLFMPSNPFDGIYNSGNEKQSSFAQKQQSQLWDQRRSNSNGFTSGRNVSFAGNNSNGRSMPITNGMRRENPVGAALAGLGIPASGYSGFIPGMTTCPPGKGFVEMVKEIEEQKMQKQEIRTETIAAK